MTGWFFCLYLGYNWCNYHRPSSPNSPSRALYSQQGVLAAHLCCCAVHEPICVVLLAGLLLRLSRLLPVLRLLPQDQAVHQHALHVCPLLPAGHRHLRHHDVTHSGEGHAGSREWASVERCHPADIRQCVKTDMVL